jgi:hypothetical protein
MSGPEDTSRGPVASPLRFHSVDDFRRAVASLGLPLTDEELAAVWPMVHDLHDQADGLREFLDTYRAAHPSHGARPAGGR